MGGGVMGIKEGQAGTIWLPINMRLNSTTDPPATLSWSRWIDHTPTFICRAANNAAPLCGDHGVGAYQGGLGDWVDYWHPEWDCLMNHNVAIPPATAPGFCHVCTDELVRAFYSVVNPVERVINRERLYSDPTGAPVPPPSVPPPSLPGDVLTVGVSGPEKFGGRYSVVWTVDGMVQPQTDIIFGYTVPNQSATVPSVHRIKLVLDDSTPMVRVDQAHPRPPNMHKEYVWQVTVASQ